MVRWLLVLALAGLAGAGACTLFDADPPDDSCMADTDCFRAQGEVCNQTTHTCVKKPMADAGVDARVFLDAPTDAEVDAP
jgi:hypothetical protein